MPEKPDKKKSLRSSSKLGMQKTVRSSGKHSLLQKQKVISRQKALRELKKLLNKDDYRPEDVFDLISLFHFHSDELTEIGIGYEMVRALEQRYPLLFSDL